MPSTQHHPTDARPPAAVVLWSAKWQLGGGCEYRRLRALLLLRLEREAAGRDSQRDERRAERRLSP